jgi:molybdopterin molybdotransferase
VDFWKVRMKPGKPLAFGRVVRDGRSIPLFGLPGNPVSCMVNFLEFVRPWMRSSLGQRARFLPVVEARLRGALRGKPGRTRLERVVLSPEVEGLIASSAGSQSSGVLTSMVVGHGFAIVPPDVSGFADGDAVQVQVFDQRYLDRDNPGFPW